MVKAMTEEDIVWEELLPLLGQVQKLAERLVEIKKEKEKTPKLTPTVATPYIPTTAKTIELTRQDRKVEAPKIGTSAWLRAKTSNETAIAPAHTKSQEQRIRDALKKREKRAREKAERELSGG
jgi:uncharacterized protein with von Willebrand factor type A (vWA) domain